MNGEPSHLNPLCPCHYQNLSVTMQRELLNVTRHKVVDLLLNFLIEKKINIILVNTSLVINIALSAFPVSP